MRELPIALRAAQPQDDPFLRLVYAGTRPELGMLDWPAAFKEGFLNMQYEAQQRHYQSAYPQASYSIVLLQDAPVGRLIINEGPTQVHLIDIALLPEQRGRGIGAHLLQQIQCQAERNAKTVLLHVEQSNPAIHLYQRLGFVVTADHGLYLEMLWKGVYQ